jgi:hypothetical protein
VDLQNPYAAPQSDLRQGGPREFSEGPGLARYIPLGWRTTAATVSVLAKTVSSGMMHVSQLTFEDVRTTAGGRSVGAVAITSMSAVGVLVGMVCSWVFVCMWIHRAASNLRGLGRWGMQYSPGECVGSFFIPFLNLWRPLQGMTEIWKASDPENDQGSWFASSSTPLLLGWWLTWLVSNLVASTLLFFKNDRLATGVVGLAADACAAAAAVMLVLLMRGVFSRQEGARRAMVRP